VYSLVGNVDLLFACSSLYAMSLRSITLCALLVFIPFISWAEVPQEEVKEFKETKLKAEQGDAVAQFNLGSKYCSGLGVLQDYAEAVRWFRKSAEQGHVIAQYILGQAYGAGIGLTKDEAEAFKWYRKSAEQGLDDAQSALGECYLFGRGVSTDYIEAYAWLNVARGRSQLSESQVLLEKKLPLDQILVAKRRTKELQELIQKNMTAAAVAKHKKSAGTK
jgi:TPR repeat protein